MKLTSETKTVDDVKSVLKKWSYNGYLEIRFQSKMVSEVVFVNGELERIRTVDTSGYGIRVLINGSWGFSSTSNSNSLDQALSDSVSLATVLSEGKKSKTAGLGQTTLATGTFSPDVNGELASVDFEQKLKVVKETERAAHNHSKLIKTSSCTYREILEYRAIANSDGAEFELFDSKPEFNISVVAKVGAKTSTASEGLGITGGWNDLFEKKDHLEYAYEASDKALRLLDANHPVGERSLVILDPGMAGLLSHEAVGHTVEADFVLSGSTASDKMGKQVASELVTMVDSGSSDFARHAGGSIAVDDEGVPATRVPIIEKGILKSFLHNRETANLFGATPTGNARAFDYTDEPLIRMRNTYIEPGSDNLEEMIKETQHGYLVRGPRNGQADANGEFMFGAQEAYLIEKGEIKSILKGAGISGDAFEVLKSIDMVGRRFEYDMGGGYCGKYQPAKVDGGGPHLRCTAIIGGLQ